MAYNCHEFYALQSQAIFGSLIASVTVRNPYFCDSDGDSLLANGNLLAPLFELSRSIRMQLIPRDRHSVRLYNLYNLFDHALS
jgi:hypothetical protein